MLKFFNADKKNSLKKLEEILNLRKNKQKIQTSKVRQIIFNVKKIGDNAVINYEKKYSNIKTNSKKIQKETNELLVKYPEWEAYFNRILIDAPCSGLGTLARHPDARWRMNKEKIQELVSLQSKLLKSLALLLQRGGKLVYSTCTIHPDENSNQIKNFLKTNSKFLIEYEKQIWPGEEDNGDGFYIAILNKFKSENNGI